MVRRAASLIFLLLGPVLAVRASEEADRAGLDAVVRRVEEIRGLSFSREVPVSRVGKSEVREYAARRLERFSTPAAVRAEETAYALLGLVPPGTSFEKEFGSLVEDAAGGYYDPESKSYFIVEGLPESAGPILAAHELTHALDDQHFDLDARIAASREDADRAFATMAVHEGSASLVMAVYTYEGLQKGWLQREDLEALASTEAVRGTRMAESMALVRRPLLGAYVLGTRFLTRGRQDTPGIDGFPVEDADRAFRAGPVSSEQILHPEKYWDPGRRDDPRPMSIPDPARTLGAGWKNEGEGTLGELLLGPLVGAPTPATWDATSIRGQGWTCPAAEGWGGDRWQLAAFENRRVLLLATAWDTARDAKEFAAALPARPALVWKRSGDRVAVVAGDLDAAAARRAARAVLKGMARDASAYFRFLDPMGLPARSNVRTASGVVTSRIPVSPSFHETGSSSPP